MSLEFNKVAGAVLAAGVVAMATGFIADLLVHPAPLEENAYPIQVTDDDGPTPPEVEVAKLEPVLPLLADADVDAGEAAFRACGSCHTAEEGGANRVGPNLWDIVGAPHAHRDDFNYSDAMEERSDEAWTYEALNAFLEDPRGSIPGTRMSYAGMRSTEDRANLIAWLRTLSDDPEPLPSDDEIEAVMAEAEEAAPEAAEAEAGEETEETAEAAPEAEEEAADTAETEAAPAPEGDSELVALIADADPDEGQSLFRRCAACHTYEEGGPNRVGPNLWNVVGGPVAHLEGFNYSGAAEEMHDDGVTWTYDNLSAFLTKPQDFMPGTRMVFPGLPKEEDRAAVIAFLREQSDEPAPLAVSEEADAAPDAADEGKAEEAGAAAEEEAQSAESERAEATDAESAEGEEAAAGSENGADQDAAADSELRSAIAEADPAEGESVSRRCAACHTFEEGGPNRVGPNLWNVVGGAVAHLESFNYSDAAKEMHEEGTTWTYENLSAFLENPRDFMPGTRMVFPGLRDLDDRAAMIAYLRSQSEDPPSLD